MTASEWKNQFPQRDDAREELAVRLGRNVMHLRKTQRINKQTFALMVGISRPYLDQIEAGTADARISLVTQLAEALAISPQELLFVDLSDGISVHQPSMACAASASAARSSAASSRVGRFANR